MRTGSSAPEGAPLQFEDTREAHWMPGGGELGPGEKGVAIPGGPAAAPFDWWLTATSNGFCTSAAVDCTRCSVRMLSPNDKDMGGWASTSAQVCSNSENASGDGQLVFCCWNGKATGMPATGSQYHSMRAFSNARVVFSVGGEADLSSQPWTKQLFEVNRDSPKCKTSRLAAPGSNFDALDLPCPGAFFSAAAKNVPIVLWWDANSRRPMPPTAPRWPPYV